jgi:hypothetical protein
MKNRPTGLSLGHRVVEGIHKIDKLPVIRVDSEDICFVGIVPDEERYVCFL